MTDIDPCLATQRRWVEESIAILGLAPGLPDSIGDRVASELDVPVGTHRFARADVAAAGTIRQRSAAVVSVLETLVIDDRLHARLIGSGLLTGVWSAAGVWNERSARIEFPAIGRALAGMRPRTIRPPPSSLSRGRSPPS